MEIQQQIESGMAKRAWRRLHCSSDVADGTGGRFNKRRRAQKAIYLM